MGPRSIASLFAFALLGAAAAQAHHSIAGVYDSARRITVEGAVTEFQFVNPHPILLIAVSADAGEPQIWRLEMDNRFELANVGMSADTFKAGDRVVATGSAHRSESARIYLRRLDRPADAFRYEQVGSRPVVSTPPR